MVNSWLGTSNKSAGPMMVSMQAAGVCMCTCKVNWKHMLTYVSGCACLVLPNCSLQVVIISLTFNPYTCYHSNHVKTRETTTFLMKSYRLHECGEERNISGQDHDILVI